MSSIRTTHPLSVKFTTVIASSALALGAAAAAAASSAPARPAAPALPATALPHPARLTTGRPTAWPGQSPLSPHRAQLAFVLKPATGTASSRLTPRQIARQMLRSFGWSRWQFPYLNWLWDRESSWNVYAENPYSGAYGIPQADPGWKMAAAGPGWRTSARTQIRWGLGYIRSTYGSPRRAWDHEVADGWY